MSTVLKVNDITMQFGGVVAVNDLSMHVDEGEIVALIGPNGAGKTTAFNCITGVYEPTNGEVWFHDKLIASNHPTGKMKKLYAGENRGKYTHVVVNTPDRITKTVSYTHLDVYKRQGWGPALSGRRRRCRTPGTRPASRRRPGGPRWRRPRSPRQAPDRPP